MTATEAPVFGEMAAFASPRFHMRIQVTKNTKGYSYETSISVDDDDAETVCHNVRQLLIDADTIARQEIARREFIDANPIASEAVLSVPVTASGAALDGRDSLNDGWKE